MTHPVQTRIDVTCLAPLLQHILKLEKFPRRMTKSSLVSTTVYLYMAEHNIMPMTDKLEAQAILHDMLDGKINLHGGKNMANIVEKAVLKELEVRMKK